jgi:exonuclease III
VKEKQPILVFLMETKIHNKTISFLKNKTGYDHMFIVDSRGRSGGLILLWRQPALVDIQNYCIWHINKSVREGTAWKFTGFYGHPETAKREEAWSLLRHLSQLLPVCGGLQ